MESHDDENISPFIPIPEVFFCSDTQKPFSTCMLCAKSLLRDGTSYMIEKAIRQIPSMHVKEIIFEYAICLECAMKMNETLSVESRDRINQYFTVNANVYDRRQKLMSEGPTTLGSWISRCLIKNTPIAESEEYQIMAQCNGPNLLFTVMPFALSMDALDEMSSLLSAKSRGEIDDFIGKYFTGPPEVSEILKKKLVIL